MINLTVAEMLIIAIFLSMAVMGLLHYKEQHYDGNAKSFEDFRAIALPERLVKVKKCIRNGFGIEVTLSQCFLTVDRFIHTVLPLRYAISSEERRVFQKLIIATWVLCVLVGMTGCTINLSIFH